ncbi:MAG TPA: SprT family zinc-dependent metalloprotease [Usitatibacter sp.]|nr:SprT family zinc-dependent metalloprotease [Usitatibacter sp.]
MPLRELVSRDLHRVALASQSVDYVLVRRRGRRGVGLKVDEGGLTVSAPATMPLARIEALVRESEAWVLKKIGEWSLRQVPDASWHDGAELPYLGGVLVLRLVEAARARAELHGDQLWVATRDGSEDQVRRAVVAWYRREARAYLAARVELLAQRAGIAPPRFLLSSAMSRWGSCNSRREVRLAWRLVKAPVHMVDYVICHELAHLRHMNHSPAFWAEVGRQYPDYRGVREALFATDHVYRSF